MTSNARELAQYPSAPQGRKNIITNGAMTVAQRSTSATNVSTAGYHACDRWNFTLSGRDQAVFTFSQNTSSIVDGFSNSFKIQATTAESAIASDEFFIVRQKVEARDLQHLAYATSSAKSTTLSFYVKSSVAATFAVYLYKPDSTARVIGGTYTINSADTWEFKTLTFAGDTDSGATITNDNDEGLHIAFPLAVGSDFTATNNTSWADYSTGNLAFGHAGNAVVTTTNATWEITGVQLEVGSVGTEFEHRSFGEELALCQRYFQNHATTSAVQYMGFPFGSFSGAFYFDLTWPVKMRAAPTVTASTWQGVASPTVYNANTNAVTLNGSSQFYANSSSTFTADAELQK